MTLSLAGYKVNEFNPRSQLPSPLLLLLSRSLTHTPSVSCFLIPVPEDLSLEERDELSNIRRRKKELLDDIEVSTNHRDILFFIVRACFVSRDNL